MKLQLIALMAVTLPLGAYAQDVPAPVASQSSFGMHDQMNGGAPGAMPVHHRPMGPGMVHGVSGSVPMHHDHGRPPHGVSGTMGGMGGHDMPPPPPPRDRPNGAMPPPPPHDQQNGEAPPVGGMQGQ